MVLWSLQRRIIESTVLMQHRRLAEVGLLTAWCQTHGPTIYQSEPHLNDIRRSLRRLLETYAITSVTVPKVQTLKKRTAIHHWQWRQLVAIPRIRIDVTSFCVVHVRLKIETHWACVSSASTMYIRMTEPSRMSAWQASTS